MLFNNFASCKVLRTFSSSFASCRPGAPRSLGFITAILYTAIAITIASIVLHYGKKLNEVCGSLNLKRL